VGLQSGPYLVLPLLGPVDVRDAAGRCRWTTDAARRHVGHGRAQHLVAVAAAGQRARRACSATTQLLDDIALDRYSFVRDAYLSRRAARSTRVEADGESFETSGVTPPGAKPAPPRRTCPA
jgi:phospholipid-binding lipoprotein MlaA